MKYNYNKSSMIGLAVAFMVLPSIFVGLRIWAKLLRQRLAWDDYLTIAALVISITCSSLQLAAAFHGHLGQHQPLDANGIAIADDPGLIFFEQTKFAINCISIVGLGLTKASILTLYKNIFDVRRFRLAVYVVFAFVVGWTISFFFSHLFTCYPITVFIEPFYGNKCVDTLPMFLALLVCGLSIFSFMSRPTPTDLLFQFTDAFADLVILVLPIPMVLNVKFGARKKAAVIGMLMLGAGVCAVSITRVVATYSIGEEYIKHPNDLVYYTAPVFFWTNIELSLGIVCACLPTVRPIWRHFHPKPVMTQTGSYNYNSSEMRSKNVGSYGAKFASSSRAPYDDLEEMELTRYEQKPSLSQETRSTTTEQGITKEVTIHQTLG
ncbi:hypothetical protein K504DRAFT_421238 [Pleomassaria siparia CBS 279.74]|uniref:Rhodopsin domain-containing protein n=1 Tax=Pleomassaria siparia CBS 279.74 TaxID=1314801 RepID=A0A6G1KQ10_9PLEO|nr:hypothetical protein K504DRAFT_421238 [Pleomassaria siparia CBS 279.74]